MTPVYKLSAPGTLVGGRLSYKSMLAGNPVFLDANFESIATVTVGAGGASSVVFSSIPSTYSHLQIRAIVRSTRAGSTDFYRVWLNNDSTDANYTNHEVRGNGAAATATGNTSNTYFGPDMPAGSEPANTFGVLIMDILDYNNNNKFKTMRHIGGFDANGSGQVALNSKLWTSTATIDSIKFQDYSAYNANFAQHSQFSLYGIKG